MADRELHRTKGAFRKQVDAVGTLPRSDDAIELFPEGPKDSQAEKGSSPRSIIGEFDAFIHAGKQLYTHLIQHPNRIEVFETTANFVTSFQRFVRSSGNQESTQLSPKQKAELMM